MLNNLPTHLHKTAISRHILKSKLVKLKAKDEFATSLLFKIENLKKTKSSTERLMPRDVLQDRHKVGSSQNLKQSWIGNDD